MIRPARAEDADALAALQVRAWHAAYGAIVDAGELEAAAAHRPERWHEILAGDHGTFVAVDGDGAPLGFVSIGAARDDDAAPKDGELYAIYLEPTFIGTGLGRELHLHAEAELAREHPAATLWVLAANARARRFYESHDWRPDGRTDPDQHGWGPAVRYRKVLR